MTPRLQSALKHARDTRAIALGTGVLRQVPALFKEQFPGSSGRVIADPRTFQAAGADVHAALTAAGLAGGAPILLEDEPLVAADLARESREVAAVLHAHDHRRVGRAPEGLHHLLDVAPHLRVEARLAAVEDAHHGPLALLARHFEAQRVASARQKWLANQPTWMRVDVT